MIAITKIICKKKDIKSMVFFLFCSDIEETTIKVIVNIMELKKTFKSLKSNAPIADKKEKKKMITSSIFLKMICSKFRIKYKEINKI